MGVLIVLLVLIVIFLATCVRVVPEAYCMVIEFFGKYQTVWEKGLHIKMPVVQVIRQQVNLKEQVADFPPQSVITKDNVTMKIDTVVYYKIFDATLFTYGVQNPVVALENLTATTLRNIIGDLELDETLTSRDIINSQMQSILDKATDEWGIKVNRVELKNIIPPAEIQQAMEKQMKAEREKRQTLLEAEAHKEAVVSRAQGDKEAKILAAEAERDAQIAMATGRAESIRLVYEAEAKGLTMLRQSQPDESVITLKKLEALKAMGDGRATKIFMPTDMTKLAESLGVATEILGTPGAVQPEPDAPQPPTAADACCNDKDVQTQSIVQTSNEIEKETTQPPVGKDL